jgi:hypothetical protein
MKKIAQKTVICLLAVILIFPLTMNTNAAKAFPDVNSDFWAYNEITFLVDQQIIKGYMDGRFGPNDQIKRIQAAEMLVKALDLSLENRPDPNFKDMKPGDYGYEIAAAVADEGIITGSEGSFKAWEPLTRGQMAKILSEAYQLEYVYDAEFIDVSDEHWTHPYVSALVGNSITTGYKDNTYRPNAKLTRTQFAVFMARVLDDSFKPSIFFLGDNPEYVWGQDDSLSINLTVYNNYSYSVKNLKSDLALVVADEIIAESYFEFGPSFELQPKESKVVTLVFKPEYVYNIVDFQELEVYSLTEVSR